MIRIALRETWARKRRLGGIAFAVFLGVALLSGTFMLTDTLGRGIKGFFASGYGGVGVVIRSPHVVENGPNPVRTPLPASVLAQVRAVPGIAQAVPVVDGYAQITGPDGHSVTGTGLRSGGNWLGTGPLNPWRLASGQAPHSDGEVVIDKATADKSGLHPGSRTVVLVPEPHPVTVVGVARYGQADALGGNSYVGFTLAAAQHYLGPPRGISASSAAGVTDTVLAQRVAQQVPGWQVITGQAAAAEATQRIDDGFLTMFRSVLSGLAALSLLVAAFSIFNTQSILAAQRTRDFALLRAVGAARRQVLAASLAESVLVGAVASVAGIFGGLGLAMALKGIFASMNLTLPGSGLSVPFGQMLIAFAVGVVVTVVAGLVPAARAARVPPVAALREVERGMHGAARRRAVIGLATLAAGGGLVAVGLAATSVLVTAAGAAVAAGAVIMLGPVLAGPLVHVLTLPWRRRPGTAGWLAARNAGRDPHRVAGTATALLVGTALVGFATVTASSLRSSVDSSVAGALRADLVISPATANGAAASLAADVESAAAAVPGVARVTGLGQGSLMFDGQPRQVTVIEPDGASALLRLATDAESVTALRGDTVAVRQGLADGHGWRVGTPIPVTYPDGHSARATVGAVFGGSGVVEDVLVPTATWRAHAAQQRLGDVLVGVAAGADAAVVRAQLTTALAPFGYPPVQDHDGYVDAQSSAFGAGFTVVYALLALAVLIAVLGIANTLGLAVYERRRELGLLRAAGLTRRGTRRSVRIEAVLVAALGSLTGTVVGAACAAAVASASDTAVLNRVDLPVTSLLAVIAGGALVGVLAAIRPARRAARLDVLAALATQ
jgi:putative ABC transport system permease protein